MANGAILNQKKANPQLSNLTNTQQALYNIGAGVRQNLLINPFFKVNQRGESLYTIDTPQYTVDCWKATGTFSSCSVGYSNDYLLIFNGSRTLGISQYIENYQALAGKTVTLSFLADITSGNYKVTLDDGTAHSSSSFPSGGKQLYSFSYEISSAPSELRCSFESVAGAQAKIYAAKLEIGSNQTLAYQNVNGDWQLLEQPDPNEILKCYRYQYVPVGEDNSYPNASGFAFSASQGRFIFPMPVPMRIAPTLSYLNGATINAFQIFKPAGGATSSITSIPSIRNTPSGIGIIANTSGLTANTPICLRSTISTPILFDANL